MSQESFQPSPSRAPPSTALLHERLLELAPVVPDHRVPEGEVLDLRQIFGALRQNLRFILKVAAVTVFLSVTLTLVWRMRFTSKARLYLGELEDKTRVPSANDEAIDLSGSGHGDVNSEIEILKSRSLVTRSILASGLNARLHPTHQPPPRYWRWLLSRRAPGLLDVAAKEVLAVDTYLADRSIPVADYVIRFGKDGHYEIGVEGRTIGHGHLGEAAYAEGLSITLLPGTEHAPAAGASYDLEVRSLDDVVYDALKALDVSTPGSKLATGDTVKVANLEFSDRSPRLASKFLENLMLGYLEERQSWKTENAKAAETFVTSRLTTMQESLDDIQKKLADYRKTNRVVVLDNEASALVEQVGKYDEQRVDAQLEVQAFSDLNEQLKKPNAPLESFMLGEAKDTVLTSLASSLVQAQQKLAEAETHYNAPAPEVRDEREQVQAQLRSIQSYVSTRLARGRANLRSLEGVIAQYEDKLRTVPGAEVGLAQLSRESEVYSTMYSFLLKRQQEMAIVEASTISKNRVLDPAEVPYLEEWPKLGLALASAPLGLLFGAIAVLFRALFSSRLQSGADIPIHLGRVPLFATIPHFSGKMVTAEAGALAESGSPAVLEAFRTLRTNLCYACARERGNVVLITSPCDGDGKTTSAYSLASALARAGRPVLLVDANLRQGVLPGEGNPPECGDLTSILEGRDAWREVVRQVNVTPEGPFHVIRSGGPASSELLSGVSMRNFITDARGCYDFVLIDAPSYPVVSDALVLASMADCILAVVRPQHTSKKQASENIRRLWVGGVVYGLVLNDVRA